MRRANHFVPSPDLAIEVLPAAVGITAERIEVADERGKNRLFFAGTARDRQSRSRHGGGLQEGAPRPLVVRLVLIAHGLPPGITFCATAFSRLCAPKVRTYAR